MNRHCIAQTSKLLLLSLFAPMMGFGQTVLEDFEGYAPGLQAANYAGSITVLDGPTTPTSPTTSKSAMFATASTQHRWNWTGAADPVITVSFDFYNGSAVTEPQPLRFAFNQTLDGGLVAGIYNITRLAMKGNGTFDIETAPTESYTDAAYPLETLMTVHMVFNSSDVAIDNYYGGESVAANSLEVWKEIDGVITHVGEGKFQNGYASDPLVVFGFGTSGSYTTGDCVIDNVRWSEGTGALGSSGPDLWAGYPIDAFGNVDTVGWIEWVNVSMAPWIYSYSLNNWIYMPESQINDSGAWCYIIR